MSLFVERLGKGVPLVMIHGWGLNSSVWQPVQKSLSKDFELYMVDLPGHGRSPLETENYSLDALADQLLPHLPDKAHWLGWSMGGLLAQHVALTQPKRIDRLVLVGSNAQYTRDEHWSYAMDKAVLEQFAEGLAKDYKTTLKRFLAIQALGSEGARQIVKVLNEHMQAYGFPDTRALDGGLTLLRNSSFVERLNNIKQTSLLMFGRLDTLAPAVAAEPMSQAMPDAQAYIFEHGAHAPFISHPDEFVTVLREFLLAQVLERKS